jgi:probable rRNA maturation factor
MSASGRPEIAIIVEEKAWRDVGIELVTKIRRAVRSALARADAPPSSKLTILLTADERVRALNKQHRDKDKPTNVLSFPSVQPDYLGDVAIAYGVTAQEAKEAGKPLANHAIHLAVHGALHLLGYDHEKPREAEIMEALETEILAKIGIADPYRVPGQAAARR